MPQGAISFLFEHASGYAILETQMHELDKILSCLETVSANFESFSKTFKLKFSPFKSAENALENCNQISEGIAHKNLRKFLRSNLNDGEPHLLYVSEHKLGDDINTYASNALPNVTISTESAALEVFRQIRRYFPDYISNFTHHTEVKAHIGLGHSYSRAKVMFNVNRDDNMVMHTINLLDQMDKDINTFSMRIKEWFSYHFPELSRMVPECSNFIKLACIVRSRQDISEDAVDKIEEVIGDHEKAVAIVEAAKTSMGLDVTDQDIEKLAYFTEGIKTFSERRAAAYDYLVSKLTDVAPNLNALIGSQVAARLMSHAGSLTKLAKCPASTIQILGAEKALFRALRTRGRTPKYGLLFHSTFIGRAAAENKGRISRFLAAKCALASRIDCFSDELCDVFGQKLKKQVEERLRYFENGTLPKTNAEAMKEAVKEAQSVLEKMRTERGDVEQNGALQTEKTKKKHRKSQAAEVEKVPLEEPIAELLVVEDGMAASGKKKKKNSEKQSRKEMMNQSMEVEVPEPEPAEEMDEVPLEEPFVVEDDRIESGKKKKKKSKKRSHEQMMNQLTEVEVPEPEPAEEMDEVPLEEPFVVEDDKIESGKKKKKKSKKRSHEEMMDVVKKVEVGEPESVKEVKDAPLEGPMAEPLVVEGGEATSDKKKKKSKKRSHEEMIEIEEVEPKPVEEEVPKKKKKKNRHLQEKEEGKANMETNIGEELISATDGAKKQSKKRRHEGMTNAAMDVEAAEPVPVEEEVLKKKKKKNKHRQEEENRAKMETGVVEDFVPVADGEKRKKNKKKEKKSQQPEGEMGE